jgi:hypothetical protein
VQSQACSSRSTHQYVKPWYLAAGNSLTSSVTSNTTVCQCCFEADSTEHWFKGTSNQSGTIFQESVLNLIYGAGNFCNQNSEEHFILVKCLQNALHLCGHICIFSKLSLNLILQTWRTNTFNIMPSWDPTLSQFNPIHFMNISFLKIHVSTILPLLLYNSSTLLNAELNKQLTNKWCMGILYSVKHLYYITFLSFLRGTLSCVGGRGVQTTTMPLGYNTYIWLHYL